MEFSSDGGFNSVMTECEFKYGIGLRICNTCRNWFDTKIN